MVGAFREFGGFELWDEKDSKANENEIFATPLNKDFPEQIDVNLRARAISVIWLDNYQSLFLEIGKLRYDSDLDSDEVAELYKNLKSRVDHKKGELPRTDVFVDMSPSELGLAVRDLEEYFRSIDSLISEEIDKNIYQSNVSKICRAISVRKTSIANREYYATTVKGKPGLSFLVSFKACEPKLIAILDSQ